MLILDWNKNSEEILRQGYYNTKRSVVAEQTHLCQYWQEQGVSKEEAYETWCLLGSPQVIACFSKGELREQFNYFWEAAIKFGYNKKYIYGLSQKEYDYIDSLDVDAEYKKFLYKLAEYCRTYGEGNRFSCGQVVWNALVKGERHHSTEAREQKMAAWNEKYGLYQVRVYQEPAESKSRNRVTLNYLDTEGEPVFFGEFVSHKRVCDVCGKQFEVMVQGKTNHCPECQKKIRGKDRHRKTSTTTC